MNYFRWQSFQAPYTKVTASGFNVPTGPTCSYIMKKYKPNKQTNKLNSIQCTNSLNINAEISFVGKHSLLWDPLRARKRKRWETAANGVQTPGNAINSPKKPICGKVHVGTPHKHSDLFQKACNGSQRTHFTACGTQICTISMQQLA
jgi:hypothetical protein